MADKLLQIIKHYGVKPQLKHLQTEVFELNEAVIQGEDMKYVGIYTGIPENFRKHIAEEIADCYVMIEQLQHYYDIDNDEILDIMYYKINRQLERISNEYER